MAGDGPSRGAKSARGGAPSPRRGVYMISVAAELAGMHPQTLRIYESRGLIEPKRSAGNTRLYSQHDVERLRRINELTNEMGMNLAGVEKVFELESELERMRSRIESLRRQADRAERELRDEIERVRQSFKAELVRYEPPGSALIPARDARVPRVRIPISRRPRPQGDGTSAA
jgi:MerR family transcriptional regulator, heat shock protein HspR